MRCPKCKHVQEGTVECELCGIVFANFYALLVKKKFDQAVQKYHDREFDAALDIFNAIIGAKIPKDKEIVGECKRYISLINGDSGNEGIPVLVNESAGMSQNKPQQLYVKQDTEQNKQKTPGMTSQNLYAPPKANLRIKAKMVDIDSLAVSNTWKARFKAIQKAGGPKLPKAHELTYKERRKVRFNVLAFLFGSFYYLAKGMWRKAITLVSLWFVAGMTIIVILHMAGIDSQRVVGSIGKAFGIGFEILYSRLANRDYYSKVVLSRNGWWW